ncbi:SirB2 family protein [Nitrincola alkalilacustris]|uniref:SirB2 family protein n=1 Tax=Nitrincola alkalilacustris TaxID=1571224 RepID=UPI00124C3D1E|nr:SirB2 family protein [Nitrincola alkalilacustris]
MATLYSSLKHLHLIMVVLSLSGFLLRGYWMMRSNTLLRHRVTRTLPHLIDTLLLASAIGMMLIIQQYPFTAPWLTAKLIGLIFYIIFGTLALKRAPTRSSRLFFFILALLAFAYITGAAITHNPMSWLSRW